MKKIILLTLFLVLLMISPSWAPGITDLEGITGLIGKEDINWGTGLSTDTFSVTTYDGGVATLTKLPNLDADGYSKIKGVWYVNNAAAITDHGVASGANYVAGNLKKVIDLVSTDSMTIELPGNTTYTIGTNLTIPSNINLRFQKGAILSVGGAITLTLNCHVEAGNYQIISGTGTVQGALVNVAKQNEWVSGPTDNSTVGGSIKTFNAITTVTTIGTITTLNNITPTNVQGDVYYRDATKIDNLAAGTKGKAFTTGGAGADPSWEGMTTQGDIEYHNGTTRTRLPGGVLGQVFTTGGPGANPNWVNNVKVASNFQSYSKILFGDGSGGDVTISADTTLTDSTIGVKVMHYNNLTIAGGKYLTSHANDKVLVILVKTLTLGASSVIKMDGRGGAGASGPGDGVNGGGKAGAFGGGGGGATTGGGGGGNGQDGDYNGFLGGGGIITAQTLDCILPQPWNLGGPDKGRGGKSNPATAGVSYINNPLSPLPFELIRHLYGGGGGSGSAVGGGLGGAGGGVLWIEAQEIVWGTSAIISSNGVAGGTVGGGQWGGGGGAGGSVQLVYGTKTGSSTITSTAGAAGGGGAGPGAIGAAGITGEFQVQ